MTVDGEPNSSAPASSKNGVLETSLWDLSWPILVSLLVSVSLTITDTLFLSRRSDAAAAAVGAVFPVLTLTNAVFTASGQAGCAIAGQLLGAGSNAKVPFVYGAVLALNVVIGLGVGIFFAVAHLALPEWLGLSGNIAGYASEYLWWVGGTQVLTALQQAISSILNSRGATRVSLVQAVSANVVNVGLNSALLWGVFGRSDGVTEVAWVTVTSKVVALAIGWLALRYQLRLQISLPRSVSVLKEALLPVIRIALPSVVEPLAFEGSQVFMTRLVVAMGPAALAARVYTFNLCILGVLWSVALGVGTQILLAHRIGAGQLDAAQRQLRQSVRFAALGGFGIVALLNVVRVPVLSMFTSDEQVLALTEPLLLLGLLLELGRATNVVVGGALRSSGDARFASLVGASMMWLIAVPLSYFLGTVLGLGVLGVWIAMTADECLRGLTNYWRWQTGAWQRFRLGASA
jgi:putative MATE family efflux protein